MRAVASPKRSAVQACAASWKETARRIAQVLNLKVQPLEGIIDIYMPDVKYMDKKYSKQFSNAPDYPEVIKEVLKEMHRQVEIWPPILKGLLREGF
jgi:uncharacterized Fe-S radical SAM superfamily protein PflX